jgi:gamma-D-glutamyl-L-lysine dipeptidyl-peptidase
MKQLPAIFIFLLLTLSGCLTSKISLIQSEADTMCKEAVPDKRIDICNVKVEKAKGGNIALKGEVLSPGLKHNILGMAQSILPGIIDQLSLLPDSSVSAKPWGVVTLSVANLKTQPSHSSEMASQAIMGTPVYILKEDNDWLYIQTPDHYLAWTGSSSLQRMDQSGMEQWKKSERLIFPDNYGVVYSDTVGSEIVSDLVAGSIIVKTGESGNFFQIALPDHRVGFVPKGHFLYFNEWKNRTGISGENLVITAKKFLGLPYMWGGTSSKAVDCSGFMKNVWFLNGIILERDASQQFRHGESVETGNNFENLQPGDVLFFGRKEPERITHTGLYIGNGEVIHSSGRVRINSMDSGKANFSRYLSGTFVGVKRIPGQKPQFGYMPVRDHPWY